MAKRVTGQPSKLSGNEFFEIVGNAELEAEFMADTEEAPAEGAEETT